LKSSVHPKSLAIAADETTNIAIKEMRKILNSFITPPNVLSLILLISKNSVREILSKNCA
jgi:hypothetical protein